MTPLPDHAAERAERRKSMTPRDLAIEYMEKERDSWAKNWPNDASIVSGFISHYSLSVAALRAMPEGWVGDNENVVAYLVNDEPVSHPSLDPIDAATGEGRR